jgi:hypothetical protein
MINSLTSVTDEAGQQAAACFHIVVFSSHLHQTMPEILLHASSLSYPNSAIDISLF